MSIQEKINEHLTLENSFVKSMQIKDEGGDVIVPRGFSLRLLNCNIGTICGRECSVHFLGGSVEIINLENSIASIDGMKVKDFITKNCRINLKKVPEELSGGDVSASEMEVTGMVWLENTESFWHEVDWNSSDECVLVNSRVEFYDCKIDLKDTLTILGSEVYFIKGKKCNFGDEVDILDLKALSGEDAELDEPTVSPDQDEEGGGGSSDKEPSTNRIRGTAGVGPGSIVNFKKIDEVKLDDGIKVFNSECNFFDIKDLKSDGAAIAEYTTSAGVISDCEKVKADGESCFILHKAGQIHINNSNLESDKPCMVIDGETKEKPEASKERPECKLYGGGGPTSAAGGPSAGTANA